MSALGHEQPRALHPRWSLLFGVAGLVLVPWIVLLYLLQPPTAAVGDLPLAAAGVTLAIVAGLLGSAVLTLAGSAFLGMTVSAAGALALCAGFFHVVTGTASNPRAAAFATVVILGPLVVLCAGIARHEVRSPGRSRTATRLLAGVLVVAALAVTFAWSRSVAAGFPAQDAHHLKLTWSVLDVAEAATLLGTAAALRWWPALVPVVAAAAGALLCCDVWFNVVGAVGEARTEAVQMAVVSIPLAIVAFVVGAREVRENARP